MSLVTNVIISVSFTDEQKVPEIVNPWLAEQTHPKGLRCLTNEAVYPFWGGSHNPEVYLWAGAFNYLNDQEFVDFLLTVPWEDPETLQVFIKRQEDDYWHVFSLGNDRYTPARWVASV